MQKTMEKFLGRARDRCVIWDIGGQRALRSLWQHYTIGTRVVMFVFDSSTMLDPASDEEGWAARALGLPRKSTQTRFEEAVAALQQLFQAEAADLSDAVLLLVATKQDLPSAMPCASIRQACCWLPSPPPKEQGHFLPHKTHELVFSSHKWGV